MFDIHQPDWLNRAMTDLGIQTGELADRANVSRSQVQRIRNGMPPRLDTLRRLTEALEAKKREAKRAKSAEQEARAA